MTDKPKDETGLTEVLKDTKECKHRNIEFDDSSGMTVCQDCFTTLRAKYDNTSTYL